MTSSGLRFGVLVASSELIPLDETNDHIYILSLETYKCPFCMNSKSQFWLFFFNSTSLLQILNIWRKLIPELEHHKLHWTQPKLVIAFDFFQSNWTVYEACISTP